MNDLHTIQKLNSQAVERDIPNQLAKGKFVVAEYTGLHFTSHSVHDTEVEANAKACEIGQEVGKRAKVHRPAAV